MLQEETWYVRREGVRDAGRPVSLQKLADAVADGVLAEADEVRGPRDRRFWLIGDHPALQEHLPHKPLFVSKSAEEAEMDMTPMIDVTFQLLIFFMITATFVVQKTLEMPNPGPDTQARARRPTIKTLQKENIIVKLAKDGSLQVDDNPTAPEALIETLRKSVKEQNKVELVLDADDEAQHEQVVQVIDAAAGAQIQRVHFVSRVSDKKPSAPAGERSAPAGSDQSPKTSGT